MQGVPGCTGAQQKIARAQEQPGERVGAHAISRVKPNQPNAQIPDVLNFLTWRGSEGERPRVELAGGRAGCVGLKLHSWLQCLPATERVTSLQYSNCAQPKR